MRDYLEEWLAGERGTLLPRRQNGGTGTVRRNPEQEGEEAALPAAERDAFLEEGNLARQGTAGEGQSLAEVAAPGELLWPVPERQEDVWPAGEAAEWPLPGQEELLQESGGMSPRELYAALGRTARVSRLAAEGAAGGSPAIVTVPAPAHEARRDWEDLDRAVQRDARRYDGGFALY